MIMKWLPALSKKKVTWDSPFVYTPAYNHLTDVKNSKKNPVINNNVFESQNSVLFLIKIYFIT